MKRLSISICICCMILFFVLCQQRKPFIQGTWQMVYNGYTTPDTSVIFDLTTYKNPPIKIFTESYFAFCRQETDSLPMAGGGTYTLVGDSTTEYVKYHANLGAVNQTYSFRVWMQNDTLYQQGDFQGMVLLEKYIRLE